jgi:prefoldin subunit 5
MSLTIDRATGELLDATHFMEALRDLDERIDAADAAIDALKENLKTARRHREGLVTELRAVARGERALPFEPSPAKE